MQVPMLASRRGLGRIRMGSISDHFAILNNVNARVEKLAVAVALDGDHRRVFHAICTDRSSQRPLAWRKQRR